MPVTSMVVDLCPLDPSVRQAHTGLACTWPFGLARRSRRDPGESGTLSGI
jgi:hypothetical protein